MEFAEKERALSFGDGGLSSRSKLKYWEEKGGDRPQLEEKHHTSLVATKTSTGHLHTT